jgi:hypothetical protein
MAAPRDDIFCGVGSSAIAVRAKRSYVIATEGKQSRLLRFPNEISETGLGIPMDIQNKVLEWNPLMFLG